MSVQIIRADITKFPCDAIVNAANSTLLGGGGVDGAIHRAAGRELYEECKTLGGCEAGNAKATLGYKLPCKHIIHTVGPIWNGGNHNEAATLASCYRNSLKLAKELNCTSIAFPLISTGAYGFPRKEGFEIALKECENFLQDNEMDIFIVVYDKNCFLISKQLISEITEYIDQNYVEQHTNIRAEKSRGRGFFDGLKSLNSDTVSLNEDSAYIDFIQKRKPTKPQATFASKAPTFNYVEKSVTASQSLDEALNSLDESFQEMLLRKIDESGMTDAECYKKAHIDRKLFSKIRNDKFYKPSKPTALAFAVALELTLLETNELLRKAGFALSHSNKFDIIVEYFIKNKRYNIFEINEALYTFDQPVLGQ